MIMENDEKKRGKRASSASSEFVGPFLPTSTSLTIALNLEKSKVLDAMNTTTTTRASLLSDDLGEPPLVVKEHETHEDDTSVLTEDEIADNENPTSLTCTPLREVLTTTSESEAETGPPKPFSVSTPSTTETYQSLLKQLQDIQRENERLKTENEDLRSTNANLSEAISKSPNHSIARTLKARDSVMKGRKVSSEDALILSVSNLRAQVEAMEDERDGHIRAIEGLESTTSDLLAQNEAYEIQVSTLTAILKKREGSIEDAIASSGFISEIGETNKKYTPKVKDCDDIPRQISVQLNPVLPSLPRVVKESSPERTQSTRAESLSISFL